MAKKHTLFLFISSFFLFPSPTPVLADNVCQYPCYPTPTPTPPVTPSTQTGPYYFPPPAFANSPPSTGYLTYYPPPSGYLPYYPPPSGYGGGFSGGGGGGGGYGYGPPPPDPILPYFPYYFKNGLHKDQPSSYSSSSSLVGDHAFLMRSTTLQVVIMAFVVVFVLDFALL